MSSQTVVAQAQVVSDSALHREKAGDVMLRPNRCAHDLTGKVRIRFTQNQWDAVVSHAESVLLVKCMFDAAVIDVTEHGSVLPVHPYGRRHAPCNQQSAIELFSGGFSGWTQVIRQLNHSDTMKHVNMRLAVDYDSTCAKAYSIGHAATLIPSQEQARATSFDAVIERVVCADIRSTSWLHLCGPDEPDLLLMSPPCPAWSQAYNSVGLEREDGFLTVVSWVTAFLVGPKVVTMENVKGKIGRAHV